MQQLAVPQTAESVPQLAQIRPRKPLLARRASKLRNEFQRRFLPLLNARHLTDGDNFHRAKLTFMYDGRFAATSGHSCVKTFTPGTAGVKVEQS